MAVTAANILFFYTGGGTNSDPNASLGGGAGNPVFSTALNNLFDNVSAAESGAGDTEYRCLIVYNDHTTDSLYDVKIWADETTSSSTALALGLDALDTDPVTIADESTAPVGITFTAANTEGTALTLTELGPLGYVGVWFRRTVTAGAAALAPDASVIRVKGLDAAP